MEDQKLGPGLACNLDFAQGKELKLKVKKFSKIVSVGIRNEQTCLTQTPHRLGSGGRPLGKFFLILGKSSNFNILIILDHILHVFKAI